MKKYICLRLAAKKKKKSIGKSLKVASGLFFSFFILMDHKSTNLESGYSFWAQAQSTHYNLRFWSLNEKSKPVGQDRRKGGEKVEVLSDTEGKRRRR